MSEKKIKKAVLIGPPGVGKTLLFERMVNPRTAYSSFYPGTETVISRGVCSIDKEDWQIIDLPPMRDLYGESLNDNVVLNTLLTDAPQAVIQVMTVETVRQTMQLSIQLAEMGIPFLIVLNKKDSVAYAEHSIDLGRLYSLFHAHIVIVSALLNDGVGQVRKMLAQSSAPRWVGQFDAKITRGIDERSELFERLMVSRKVSYPSRFITLMLVLNNAMFINWFRKRIGPSLWKVLTKKLDSSKYPVWAQSIRDDWRDLSEQLALQVSAPHGKKTAPWIQLLGSYVDHPLWGWLFFIPILLASCFLLIKVAAGVVVAFLETEIFGKYIIPGFISFVSQFPFSPFIKDLFIGDYGLLTMGLSYLVAIIFPVVFMLFFIMALLDDSGYNTHAELLLSRFFGRIGLSSEAFSVFCSGFGCTVLALAKTKLLPSSGQRTIAAFLLVLAVPCIAQLGVILNMLSVIPLSYALLFVVIVFLQWYGTGMLLTKIVPNAEGGLVRELPVLHLPRIKNVLSMTWQHTVWYFREAFPLFLLATLFLFLSAETGLLELVQRLFAPIMSGVLGLPPQSVEVFVLGFLRRDYGAARLYEMTNNGSLNAIQVLVSLLIVTLSVPCVSAFLSLLKEQGMKKGFMIGTFIFFYALLLGGLVNVLLHL